MTTKIHMFSSARVKMVQNPCSHNVKFMSAITVSIKYRAVKLALYFIEMELVLIEVGGSNGVTAIFVT